MPLAQSLTAICLVCTFALVLSERWAWSAGRVVFKLSASTAFVGLAWSLDASSSPYGRLILLALVLGWLGDALLLSAKAGWFLAGLGAFLLAHLSFAMAFAVSGIAWWPLLIAAAACCVAGALVLRWLWPHLSDHFRGPVLAYVLAIFGMCSVACSYAAQTDRWWVLAAAVVFAISDIFVARDRFVQSGFANRAWGLPLYFAAQVTLAWSVVAPP
jgi:uncharacterized membrane protein YhhN